MRYPSQFAMSGAQCWESKLGEEVRPLVKDKRVQTSALKGKTNQMPRKSGMFKCGLQAKDGSIKPKLNRLINFNKKNQNQRSLNRETPNCLFSLSDWRFDVLGGRGKEKTQNTYHHREKMKQPNPCEGRKGRREGVSVFLVPKVLPSMHVMRRKRAQGRMRGILGRKKGEWKLYEEQPEEDRWEWSPQAGARPIPFAPHPFELLPSTRRGSPLEHILPSLLILLYVCHLLVCIGLLWLWAERSKWQAKFVWNIVSWISSLCAQFSRIGCHRIIHEFRY